MSRADKFERAFRIGEGLIRLGMSVFRAIKSDDEEKVDEILESELMISVERWNAEHEADEKFGR